MSDQLASGQRFRVLNVVDSFTRENLVVYVGTSITAVDVERLLGTALAERAPPAAIVTDNGPKFISRALDQWVHVRNIQQVFVRPGKGSRHGPAVDVR